MDHQGTVIRPPSEADSILLQVTLGCTHNRCAFCGAYKDKPFRVKSPEIVARDLDFARRYCRRQRRVFLCDGDVLSLSHRRLTALLTDIRRELPWVVRVGAYASARGLLRKTAEELAELRALGLGVAYLGLESGHDPTLAAVGKGVDAATIVAQGQKLRAAGIKLNVTVLLGLAGMEASAEHAKATGQALTAMAPEQVGALTLMLIPGTPLHADHAAGLFLPPPPSGILAELGLLLAHTHLERGLFFANHASNHLPLRLRLPRDKEAGLALIEAAAAGRTPLRPEWTRAL